MMDFIGVADGSSGLVLPSPKREALLFDKIAILHLDKYLQLLRSDDSFMFSGPEYALADEYEWLQAESIIFDPQLAEDNSLLRDSTYRKELAQAKAKYGQYKRFLHQRFLEHMPEIGKIYSLPPSEFENVSQLLRLQREATSYYERCACIQLRQYGYQALPLYPFSGNNLNKKIDYRKTQVLSIILKHMPIPDRNTPWENILEFRNDPDSKGALAGLRVWFYEVAKGELELDEIEAKLEYLLYEYRKAMKIHQMKYRQGIFETIVVTTADVLEQLIKFEWGKLAKGLFSLNSKKFELLEAEMNAPGREISYIVKAQEEFGHDP